MINESYIFDSGVKFTPADMRSAAVTVAFRVLEGRGLNYGKADMEEVKQALQEWFETVWKNQ